jgi:hypothetical protein
VAIAWSALAPATARAQEDERSTLNREGLELADAGRWDAALERFQRVVALRSSAKGWFNLARAEDHLGRGASAERDYQHAIDDAKPGVDADVVTAAQTALRDLSPRVAHVRVRFANPSNARAQAARAELDGHPVSLETPASVDPGEHAVAIRVDGTTVTEKHLHVGDREQVDLPIELPASPVGALPSPAPVAVRRPSVVGPLVVGGIGVASMAPGLALYFSGKSSFDSVACTSPDCNKTQAAQANGARTNMVAGDVLIGVGAALAAVGVTWLTLKLTTKPSSVTVGVWGTGGALDAVF